jgi:hypothetical protein
MSQTTNQGLIVADPTDVNDVPASFTELLSGAGTPANALENRLVQRYLSIVDRTARNPTPQEGELSYLADLNRYESYTGSVWLALTNLSTYLSVVTAFSGMASLTYTTAGAAICGVAGVVPASGQVRVDWSATTLDNTNAAQTTYLAPQLNTGNVVGGGAPLAAVTDDVSIHNFGINAISSSGFTFYSGLTPGADVNAFLLHRVDGGAGAYAGRKAALTQA